MAHAHLPGRTTRAIDRLAKRAHAFHRFAHHPLCGRYTPELIPLGRRTRVCRGCAYAALGALSGALGAWALKPALAPLLLAAGAGLGLLLGSFARRLPKSLGRGLAVAALSFATCSGLLAGGAARWCGCGLLVLSYAFLLSYRKRGPNRSPCQTCPERLVPRTCSGLQPIVRRERAFQRVAQRLIDSAAANGT